MGPTQARTERNPQHVAEGKSQTTAMQQQVYGTTGLNWSKSETERQASQVMKLVECLTCMNSGRGDQTPEEESKNELVISTRTINKQGK